MINGGTTITVSWAASADPDGNLYGYRLERSIDGGAFVQIHQGVALSATDTVPFGTSTVAYRVKAYDADDMESGYQTSPTRTVINNNPPVIDGADSDLGLQSGAFSQGYTVTDPDAGAVLTVRELIDGVQKRQYTAVSGAVQTFEVTPLDFIKLGNGSHTLTVVATDQYNAEARRVFSFSRSETQISVRLEQLLAADAMPQRIVVNVERLIPPGASFQVLVCNNGNDASPTWEDCTNQVLARLLYRFQNTEKTAADWGANVKVLVDRGTAAGECHIALIGGNFD